MNSTDINAYKQKIKLLFEKLSAPEFVLDYYYADNLISRLAVEDKEVEKLLESDLIPEFLIKSVHLLTASCSVKTFYIRLVSVAVKNELHFTKLFYNKVLDSLMLNVNLKDLKEKAQLKCSYIEVLTSALKHSSGVKWILENSLYKMVYDVCYQKQTVFIQRGAYRFLTDFLWKLNDAENEESLISVLDYILTPIIKSEVFRCDEIIEPQENSNIIQQTEPAFDILTLALADTDKFLKQNILLNLLMSHFNITYYLLIFIGLSRDEQFLLKLSKIIFLSAISIIDTIRNDESANKIEIPFHYTTMMLNFIQRRLLSVAIQFSCTSCYYWSKFCSNENVISFAKGKQYDVLNQLVFIAMCPLLVNLPIDDINPDHPINSYFLKMFHSSCQQTTRIAYGIKNLVVEASDANKISIKHFTNILKYLTEPLANIIYQGLHYLLCTYIPMEDLPCYIKDNMSADKKSSEKFDLAKNLDFVIQILEAIYVLINNYNISWHQSYEIIFLYSSINTLLKVSNVTTNFTIVGLKLLNLCISKFLQPNMALLIESNNGSPIEDLGCIIYTKMHDLNWEIRDSALEVLLTCTELAFIKYTPFQKLITKNRLMSLAAMLAINDKELYVKSSALRCLTAAAKVSCIWEDTVLAIPDVNCQMILLLVTNEEGVIRKECMLHYRELYVRQKLVPMCKVHLYKQITEVTLKELHYEVQINALCFWQVVIQEFLTKEGMIDGCFPSVTFSKESKKIVTLNDIEIKKRLTKVLYELAKIGCLKSLCETVKDDCDETVIAKSAEVANELVKVLLKYNITSVIEEENLFSETESSEMSVEQVKEEPMDTLETEDDTVIDDILNTNDVNLLAKMYKEKVQVSSYKTITFGEKEPSYYYINPNTFLNTFINNSYQEIIAEKQKWKAGIRSLHSLLDDIVGRYDLDEVNDLDCY